MEEMTYFAVVRAITENHGTFTFRIQSNKEITKDDVSQLVAAQMVNHRIIEGVRVGAHYTNDSKLSQLLYDSCEGEKGSHVDVEGLIRIMKEMNPDAEFTNLQDVTRH